MKRFLDGARRRVKTPGGAIAVGTVLLAVPTVFSLVPEWARWHGGIRAGVLLVWGSTALLSIYAAWERDDAIQQLSEETKARLHHLRRSATHALMEALFRTGTRGIPDHYEFTVYVLDDQANKLVPIWPVIDFRGEADPREFSPGDGATGSAWKAHRMVVITGSEVANDKYGLTAKQQEFFKDYVSAAATPIWGDTDDPFGVVTALGLEDDGYFSGDSPGQDSLRMLAEVVGVVLTSIPAYDDL